MIWSTFWCSESFLDGNGEMGSINTMELRILRILEHDFNIPPEVAELNRRTSLLLPPFCMDAVDLTYFLLELQEEFTIGFLPEDYDSYRFQSIESIERLINDK